MTSLIISNIVLWIVVITQAVLLLALVRQLGVLHERIAPAGALMLKRGLTIGKPVPAVDATGIRGEMVRVGGGSRDGLSTLILFVSPSCPVCKSLLPIIQSARRQERRWLHVVLASDGDIDEHRRFVVAHGLDGIPYVLSTELGMTYQVSQLPFAALIDAEGNLRGRGLVNSREHLESLFEAQRTGIASIQEFFEKYADRPPAVSTH